MLIYKSPRCFLSSFEPIGLWVQEKKRKIILLGFPIVTILAIYDLQVTPMIPISSFKSIGLSVQKKKRKIDFQDGRHGGHLGFPVGTILAFFSSTSHPNASYQVCFQLLAFQFRRRSEKHFSRWPPWLLKQWLTPHDGRRTTDID